MGCSTQAIPIVPGAQHEGFPGVRGGTVATKPTIFSTKCGPSTDATQIFVRRGNPRWLRSFVSTAEARPAASWRLRGEPPGTAGSVITLPSGGVVIGGQCSATWRGNSAARARRCPKKSAAWRRTFAVLATFSGNMLSSGSGMRKRRAAHATALRVSAADAERSRAYSATRSSSVSPPAPCFRGGGSVHFGRGSWKSVRPPNAVLLYDSGDIKRLSCEAWGVLKRS